MKEKCKEISAELLSLMETISIIQEQLKTDDMVLLKVYTVILLKLLNQCFQKSITVTLFFYIPDF